MTTQKTIHHLPVEAYTSQEWFNREQEMIFSKTWRFAGFVEDIKEACDFISVQAGLNNLFIIKGHDGELRAFHNICRHRGTQLLRAAGNGGKAITCPYHDWTYDFKGDLVSVPEQKKNFLMLIRNARASNQLRWECGAACCLHILNLMPYRCRNGLGQLNFSLGLMR